MAENVARLLRRLRRLVASEQNVFPSSAHAEQSSTVTSPSPVPIEFQPSTLIPRVPATVEIAVAAAAIGTIEASPRSAMPPPRSRPSKSSRPSTNDGRKPGRGGNAGSSRESGNLPVADCRKRRWTATAPAPTRADATNGANERVRSGRKACGDCDGSAVSPPRGAGGAYDAAATPNVAHDSKKRPFAALSPAKPAAISVPSLEFTDVPESNALSVSPHSCRERGPSGSPRSRSSKKPVRQPPAVQLLQHLQSLLVARPTSQEQERERREQLAALSELTMDLLVENVELAISKTGGAAAAAPGTVQQVAATEKNSQQFVPRTRASRSNASAPPEDSAAYARVAAARLTDVSGIEGSRSREDNGQDCAATTETSTFDCDAAAAAVAAVVLLAASAASSSSDAPSPRPANRGAAASAPGRFPPSLSVPPLVSPSSPTAVQSPPVSMFPRQNSFEPETGTVGGNEERITGEDRKGSMESDSGSTPAAAEGCNGFLSDSPLFPWDEFLRLVDDRSEELATNTACGLDNGTPLLEGAVLVQRDAEKTSCGRSVSGQGMTNGDPASDDVIQMQELLSELMQSPGWREASVAVGGSSHSGIAACSVGLDPWMQSVIDSADEFTGDATGCSPEPPFKRICASSPVLPESTAQ